MWWLFEAVFVRPTPQVFYGWRRFALRLFGARLGSNVLIRPGVRITFPWKLSVGNHSWIGENATIYNIAPVAIGEHSVISQEAYLCTATHDHHDPSFPLVATPISIENECWVASRAFIGPGVTVGQGAVVGAHAVVLSNVEPGIIVAGVPARKVGTRSPARDL